MKALFTKLSFLLFFFCYSIGLLSAQVTLRGTVTDETEETLIGASVVVVGTTTGITTDFDGNFELTVPSVPTKLVISYVGYASDTIQVENGAEPINIVLGDNATTMVTVEVKGRRISEKRQQSALTMETLDNIAIKETPAANFYDGLGALKDVDLTAASLGFKIINTRGFNSTNPVRSLQIIDGVDNQSPGLNFSLGNFLGASDLDVNSVNIIVGASSAFYGPNAFNGVISMETKDPFLQQGLSATVKVGERQLIEGGFRWADAIKNKEGQEFFAYKINAYGFQANDWVADNYDAVDGTDSPRDNPGGYDAVNIYGDEYNRLFDNNGRIAGLGVYHRKGYREIDVVDYDSENLKASAHFQFRLDPEKDLMSPELIMSSNYSTGTTIYQGDNRFSLRNIQFFQHKVEFRQRNKFFLRSYVTHEDAGDSYDPYFTALLLQDSAATSGQYKNLYEQFWERGVRDVQTGERDGNFANFFTSMEGFPLRRDFIGDPTGFQNAVTNFLLPFRDSLIAFNQRATNYANSGEGRDVDIVPFFEPGTARFDSLFNYIVGRPANGDFGTQFFDRSALWHSHGEYMFNDLVKDAGALTDLDLRAGANFRYYFPNSDGTILLDTAGNNINTYEYGIYGGGTATFVDKWKVSASLRMDKHENFDYLLSPAASIVYVPDDKTTLRLSLSSAIRNPTLSDQFLNYNVGRATLLGNLTGFDSLVTIESLQDFTSSGIADTLQYFNIAPIRPEQVQTVEIGARTTLWEKIFLDATYYYSVYTSFIGFNLGADLEFAPGTRNLNAVDVFRVSSNAEEQVTTQGFSIGGSYYFGDYFAATGNYSWNVLNTETDDPIIPAFNTPEHKYNLGLAGRDIPVKLFGKEQAIGFNVNYKWIDGFIFEGSPQFTGFIPSYGLLDAQVNLRVPNLHSTLKIGASNLLDNQVFTTYGGPRIGRLAYASITYDFKQR